MVKIDAEIDNKTTPELVADLAELTIRNRQAFSELKAFNETSSFLYKHPLLMNFSLENELRELLKRDSDKYLEEYANTRENVKRYKSFLNNKSRSQEQKERDNLNLEKHTYKVSLMKKILSEQS